MATVLRPLLATRIDRRRRDASIFAPPNLLVTTLVIATIARSTGLPPVERPERAQPDQPGSFRALLAQSPTPLAQREFYNPQRRKVEIQYDQLGTPQTLILLYTPEVVARQPTVIPPISKRDRERQTQQTPAYRYLSAAQAAPPFALREWPVTVRREADQEYFAPTSLIDSLLYTTEVVPRKPTYAEPSIKHVRERQVSQQSAFPYLLATQDVAPFQQPEWPTSERPENLDAHAIFTVTYEAPPPDPFGQKDWRVPVRKLEIDTSFHQNPFPRLTTAIELPFSQTEWPLVRKIERFQETPQPNLQKTLYVLEVVPFHHTDWPTAERLFGRFDYNLPSVLGELPPPPIPFNQNEWVNPARKQDPHFDVWGQSLQHTTLYVENVKPFNQSDWNVAFLFDAREIPPFLTAVQAKLITEGFGTAGLQPPQYIIGTMSPFGIGAVGTMSALGIAVDGTMADTEVIEAPFDQSQGERGSMT